MFIRHYWKPIVLLTALSMRDRTPSLHVHTSKWINVHKSWLALLFTVIVFSCPQKFWTFRINRCIFVNMILWCVQTNVHMTLTQSNPITSSHSSLKLYFSATSRILYRGRSVTSYMLLCVTGLGSHLVRVLHNSHTLHMHIHIFQCFPVLTW